MGLVDQAHPSLQTEVVKLEQISSNPTGLIADYPILQQALVAQLPGLIKRDQMIAHNLRNSPQVMLGASRVEGLEIVESIWRSLRAGEKVDGRSSREGADYAVFVSIYDALMQNKGLSIPPLVELELRSGLALMRLMGKIWSGFNPDGEIVNTVKKNWEYNYPETPHKAPRDWTAERMSKYYVEHTKPNLKAVRSHFPDRVLPIAVATAINEIRDEPPAMYSHVPGLIKSYQTLISEIPKE